jgi:hypothetical protein
MMFVGHVYMNCNKLKKHKEENKRNKGQSSARLATEDDTAVAFTAATMQTAVNNNEVVAHISHGLPEIS